MDQPVMMQDVSRSISQDEEIALIKAAQQDPADFAQVYRQYVKPIYRYLYNRLGRVDDAEDLTAQVFLEAIRGLEHYRHNGPFAAWLFTIARRRVIDYLRRQRPLAELNEEVEASEASADPLAQVIQRDESQKLQVQLAGLKESDRELLRLRFAAGLSFAEISHVLKHSQAAVKMNLYRLLRRLESQLEESHE